MRQIGWGTTLLSGAVAGIVDIGAASAINGFIDPARILKFIAGGLIGLTAARAGGLEIVIEGAVLQIFMAVVIAAIYAAGIARLPVLRHNWLPAGIAFGVGVFVVMEFVVVPLSAIGHFPTFTMTSLALNLAAMMLFGTITAWFHRA